MKKKDSSGIARLTLCIAATAVLAACGGGGDGGSSSGSSSSPGNSNTTAASAMSGTVAIGNALVGAPVTVMDATGKTTTVTSGSNGTYSVSISGLTAPFVITATDPSGASGTLYSVVASAATSQGAPVTANVTPLTTAVAALLTASGNPLTLTQSGGLTAVTSSSVSTAIATLDKALAQILNANGLSASSFDPVGGAFTPNQSGADAVIDAVAVAPSAKGTGLQLTSLADPDTPIALNQGTTAPAALSVPTQPANYLATLVSQLGQCMNAMQATPGTTNAACASAIDASYLNDGYKSFGTRHTLFTKGTTLQGVKTVAFLPAGTLPAISNPAALVYFLVTEADGTPNFASDVVQKLPNGTWDIIGNQAQYDIYIASFVGRTQFTNSADAGNGRLESGLNIQIPVNMKVNGLTQYVGSALVTGPGLPASGVYMLSPSAGIGPYLAFPLKAVTAPPAHVSTSTPSWPDVGMSTQYKWSWASLSGGASAFTPTTPEYTPAPVDVSTIRQHGVYTITLYDANGQQIGTPQKVLNIASNMNAAAGTTVSWQTLGSDVIANLLTAGGSGTSTASSMTMPTANIDWTVPTASLAYPNPWVAINSQGAGVFTNGVQTYQAQPYDVMNWATPKVNGTTYSSTLSGFVDQLTSTANANAESAVQVQLGWQAGGDYYINTWQYNN
ncbi:carboxypeptidase regulatory-like domain-containing protein [Burkholderia sp. D-99]|nr:carboxypeptidase regulatory-like domain-containing protein [Burkholderia sp. D-99]